MKNLWLLLLVIWTLGGTASFAERLIPFQGQLKNAQGNHLADQRYSLTFRIYSEPLGGTALVTEEHPAVSVIGGYVNVLLGTIESFEQLDFSQTHYLGIAVGGGQEMVPRHQLVPAFHARTAERATLANIAEEAEVANWARGVMNGGVTREALNDDLKGVLIPSDAVMFFDGRTCPTGWKEVTEARGRVLVGLPINGTLKATQGTPLKDKENRGHSHSLTTAKISGGTNEVTHSHKWSRWNNSENSWKSWKADGQTEQIIIDWNNGFGNEGSGHAAIAKSTNADSEIFYTTKNTHSHNAGTLSLGNSTTDQVDSLIPTIQLLVCKKS
ncbi:MAG: hypothetical protein R3B95_14305 [Nitrospirales bacterium]|nr:hypothetical protein [Nitrospirales bacterium]